MLLVHCSTVRAGETRSNAREAFYFLCMADNIRIKGEFLRIVEVSPTRYLLQFVDENGAPQSYDLSINHMNEMAKGMLEKVERSMNQYLNTPNGELKENQRKNIEQWMIHGLWPQIHIAHLRNEDLRRFFDPPDKQTIEHRADNWIQRTKVANLLHNNFAPFRYCAVVTKQENGTFIATWWAWFPEGEELKQIRQIPEEITDSSITECGFGIEMERRLNAIEEARYRESVKSLSLPELKKQRDLWRNLSEKSPLMSPNLMVRLVYAPTVIIEEEIQERIVEVVTAEQSKTVIPTTREYLKDRCKIECDRLHLPLYQTVSREMKYELAKILRLDGTTSFKDFKSGHPVYHLVSKMLSELNYCKKNPTKYRK